MSGSELLRQAGSAYDERRFDAAIELSRAAIAAGLDVGAPTSERGEYYEQPETAQAELVLGLALFETGDADEAIVHLDRAVYLHRQNPRFVANRGHFRRERGELELALADFDEALRIDPNYAFARFRRAQTLSTFGRAAEAELDLDVVLRRNPYDEAPLALWRTLRLEQGKTATDEDLPEPINAFEYVERAAIHAQRENYRRAIRDYDAALALNLSLVMLLGYRGFCYRALGENEAARSDFETYLANDPDNVAVREALRSLPR